MIEPAADSQLSTMLGEVVAQLQSSHIVAAESILHRILERWPGQPDALHFRGICFYQQGNYPAAIDWLDRAVIAEPLLAVFRFNLGNALRRGGQSDRAIDAYRQAIRLQPNLVAAYRAMAETCRDAAQLVTAAEIYQQLAEGNGSVDDWSAAGEAWLAAGELEKAIGALSRAVALEPKNCKLWNNLGVAYSQRGFIAQGLEAFGRAVELAPSFVRALGNYANALRDAGLAKEAIQCFAQAVEQAPHDSLIRSNALFSSLYSDAMTAEEVLAAHRKFEPAVLGLESPLHRVSQSAVRRPGPPIRIAYLSPDFCDHPVAYFIDGLLRHHRSERVSVFLYATKLRDDEWSRRLRARAVAWRDVSACSDDELKAQCRVDAIDILIDLAGHTAYNRMPAVARRLAPIQVHYLGYPFSTGIAAVDYRITDEVVDPVGNDHLASEALVRLSRCYYGYTAPESAPEITTLPMLENGFPTFGVCSNLSKVSSLTLDRWAELISVCPGSTLRWRARSFDDQATADRMINQLARRGLNTSRIYLEPWTASGERWNFFSDVDIALDTFPYNQATNTCEALWMGVPTLTFLGCSHQARMGASIMQAAGLSEFVAVDSASWRDNGHALVRDSLRLSSLRLGMRERLKKSPLLDVVGLTNEIEAIYDRLISADRQMSS